MHVSQVPGLPKLHPGPPPAQASIRLWDKGQAIRLQGEERGERERKKNKPKFQKGSLPILQERQWNSLHVSAKIHVHGETEVHGSPGATCGKAVTASETHASASRSRCTELPETRGGSLPVSCWLEEDM